jgi:hypothetical protein
MQTPKELLKQIEQSEAAEAADRGELPPITRLTIDVEGTRGKRYRGEFTYHVPTLADQIQMGRLKSTYLPQGSAADANAAILAEQICYLAVTIQDPTPEWWNPFAMYDAAPVGALYGEALTYERKFHGTDADSADNAGRAGEPETEQDGGSDEDGEASMGRKVQPPAKRRETIVAHAERGG